MTDMGTGLAENTLLHAWAKAHGIERGQYRKTSETLSQALRWAATQPDDVLLRERALGRKSLARIRQWHPPTSFLLDRLESWRDTFDHPPSDEEMLGQFLYSAIVAFVTESWEELYTVLTEEESTVDLDTLATTWVDRYAADTSRSPSE